jgi:hypothetical protein
LSSKILAAAREKGVELGGSVGQVPEVWGFAHPYWEAFDLLAARRDYLVGMAAVLPRALDVSEIRAAAPLFGFEDTDLEFVQIISALDNEYLAIQAEQRTERPKHGR